MSYAREHQPDMGIVYKTAEGAAEWAVHGVFATVFWRRSPTLVHSCLQQWISTAPVNASSQPFPTLALTVRPDSLRALAGNA